MFVTKNKVRMHDTDMAGILYFPRQFRFVHDAFEELLEQEGLGFDILFNRHDFTFVIVHAEADYISSLKVGDRLEVHLKLDHIGNTSFTLAYAIYKEDKTLTGTAKTVHVCLNRETREKISVPPEWRKILENYR